ncbi:MAG: SDR family NAD(P)-dependent oxidoreductase [Jatrophihabitantaceae bacterium]
MTESAGPRPTAAVVTGAATGLGRSFAARLAGLGHAVAVCDLLDCGDTVDAIRGSGGTAFGARADASDPGDVSTFAEQVHDELGPVGVLVNNVGISPYAAFSDITLEQWRSVMTVNLDSLFLMTRAFLPDMIAAGGGRIVNLTSSVGWDPQSTQMVHYATSKLGVVGFTRSLAGEVGGHGVTVNCIAPGLVATPALLQRVPSERWADLRERQSVKRTLEPSDLLAALEFLVSPGAQLVTGTVVPVNGGRVWL